MQARQAISAAAVLGQRRFAFLTPFDPTVVSPGGSPP
jgi:hypothetical protein